MFPSIEETFEWRGTNFPELYEWLTKNSILKNFKIRVVDPGNKDSSIFISFNEAQLTLQVGDKIGRTIEEKYYIIES